MSKKERVWKGDPDRIALTFADYVDPECSGVRGRYTVSELSHRLRDFLYSHDRRLMERLAYVGTGADSMVDIVR